MRYVDSFSQEEINVILTRIFDGDEIQGKL